VALTESKAAFRLALEDLMPDDTEEDEGAESFPASDPPSHDGFDHGEEPAHGTGGLQVAEREEHVVPVTLGDGTETELDHGRVVIAAITSCTNTSNPSVMLGAGLLAKNAVERGLKTKPWVKTSLAPGSKVVTEYYERAGVVEPLEELGFHLVGYGCTTCIGNSGPLPEEISDVVQAEDLAVVSVLSGNRNFEGRINPDVKMNYLASPPLVVAYALAGTMDIDLLDEPLGQSDSGEDVYLKDIWPSAEDVARLVEESVHEEMFQSSYGEVFDGDERWNSLEVPEGDRFAWDPESTYVRRPTFLEDVPKEPSDPGDIEGARVLAKLGDSVTTDHISPAGAIKKGSPAALYLNEHGVEQKDFNSYGSRRGNHEVMVRGTFANIRLRNQLAPGTEGGITRVDGEEMTIYDAAMKYASDGVPLVVLAGKEYGSGSSRDWAAKGTNLLGVRAVIAESFERIHRSNLVGMGVLPLQFQDGENAESLGLTGEEEFSIAGIEGGEAREVTVRADGKEFTARVRIDTPKEVEYYRHGGILPFVLRQLLAQ
jgi:aconitate hydratase